MSIIESTISLGSDAFKANRDGMLALIARMRALEERTRAASAAAKDRFHKRGQLLPRERVGAGARSRHAVPRTVDAGRLHVRRARCRQERARRRPRRRHRLRLRHPLHGQRQRFRHRRRRAAALWPRQDHPRAGTRAGKQAALRAAGRKRRREPAEATASRISCAAATSSAISRGCRRRACRSSPSRTAPPRRAARIRPACPITS